MQLRKTILLLLMGCMFLSSSAFADQEGDYTYTVTDENATITGYTGTGGAISIPATLGGYPTVAIGGYAFYQYTSITNVAFPSSLVSIGNYAFAECTGLTSVGIIPIGVASIGEASFSSCTGLTSINVDADNPTYISQDGVLYNYDKTVLIQFPAGKTGVFAIPDSVTTIGTEAFRFSTHITSITIPDSVTSIRYRGFSRMYALTAVTIPASVTSIGTYGFFGGTSNTGITVRPDNPNYSSVDGVLYNKDKTLLIQYPCGKAGALVIPSSVTSVGIAACELAAGKITSISFMGNVETIAEAAFEGLTNITSITFPNSLTSIGRWAFDGCASLTSAYFYGNAPTMGIDIFDNCAPGFTVYYLAEATGFSDPWYGYPTAVFTPAGSFALIQPNGGESWNRNSRRMITWNAKGCQGTLKLTLWQNNGLIGTIADGVSPAAGSYSWTVGNYIGGTAPLGTGYTIKIEDNSSTLEDLIDGSFSIVKISVKAPNGGESWQISSTQNITWLTKIISNNLRIVLFRNGIKVGNIVNSIDPALETYAWTVGNYIGGTATAGTGYQVQVREIGTDAGDRSDTVFTLTAP